MKHLTIVILSKIMWFLDEQMVASLYDLVWDILAYIFRVDTDYMLGNRNKAENIIYTLASKFRLKVTIERMKL